jgi:hypothetical protein
MTAQPPLNTKGMLKMIYELPFLILFAILFPKALRFLFALLFLGGIALLGEVHANDFLATRECTVAFKNKAPIHTTCIIKGGEQGGIIDVSIRTPDGRVYSLDGPIDGEGGHEFLLQNHLAKKTSQENAVETCYSRDDGKLEICAK